MSQFPNNENAYNRLRSDSPHYDNNRGQMPSHVDRSSFRDVHTSPLSTEVLKLPNHSAELTIIGLKEAGLFNQTPGLSANVNTVAIVVDSVIVVLRKAFALDNIFFEDADNIKRKLKVGGAKAMAYPRTSVSFSALNVKTENLHGGRAMQNTGVIIPRAGKVQPSVDRSRFIPVTIDFRVVHFNQDQNKTVDLMQSIALLAGMRSLACSFKFPNGQEHRLSLSCDGAVSANPISFESEEEDGAGTIEFTVTADFNVINLSEKEPLRSVATGLFVDGEEGHQTEDTSPAHLNAEPELTVQQQILQAMENADDYVLAKPGRVIPPRP